MLMISCPRSSLLVLLLLVATTLLACLGRDPSFDHLVDPKDFHGPDGGMLHDLKHSMRDNAWRSKCNLNGTDHTLPLVELNIKYVHEVTAQMEGILSAPRRRATAWLSKAALTLPEGDFVETGVYVGTSSAIMMNVLMHFDTCNRKLWAFDSFEGLPPPSQEDRGHGRHGEYNASMDTFLTTLKTLNAYDEKRLVVTKGWFKDTCPKSAVQKIAFLRLDGDLFASTWDAIAALYDRVVPGGYIYVDDYASFNGCKLAIDMFRTKHRIFEPMGYVHEGPPKARSLAFEAVWWVKRTD